MKSQFYMLVQFLVACGIAYKRWDGPTLPKHVLNGTFTVLGVPTSEEDMVLWYFDANGRYLGNCVDYKDTTFKQTVGVTVERAVDPIDALQKAGLNPIIIDENTKWPHSTD